MSAALRDYALLWRAALATRKPQMNAILCCVALLGALSVGGLAWMKTSDPFEVAINCVRAIYAMLVVGWLMTFIQGAIGLNTPANAMLVPRVRRRAMQLTALLWLAAAAGGALLALRSPVAPMLVFLAVGLVLVVAGLARGGHPAGMLVYFLVPIGIMLNRALPRAWLPLLGSTPALAAAGLLLLALGAFALQTMFPHGGDRHFRLRVAQKLAADRTTVEGQLKHASVPRLGRWIYDAALLRACSRRDARLLLMHVLGPSVHLTGRLLSMIFFVAIAAGVMAVLRVVADAATLEGIAGSFWLALSTVLLLPLFDGERRLMRLSLTRGEQRLVRLAPSMPGRAGAFNRLLAARLLLAGLAEWALVSIGVLCVVALTGASSSTLWMQACLCCLALPLLAAALRDHARRSGTGGWWMVLWQAAALGACFLAGIVAQRTLGTPVLPVAALASVLIAAAALAWRWRRLAGAPHAFPVGRFA